MEAAHAAASGRADEIRRLADGFRAAAKVRARACMCACVRLTTTATQCWTRRLQHVMVGQQYAILQYESYHTMFQYTYGEGRPPAATECCVLWEENTLEYESYDVTYHIMEWAARLAGRLPQPAARGGHQRAARGGAAASGGDARRHRRAERGGRKSPGKQ
jgi:hypothetical protein